MCGGGFAARRKANGPQWGREGAYGCGGRGRAAEGVHSNSSALSFGASTNQTDPGLPTERSLRQGPRFPTPPPQLWVLLVAQIVKNQPARQESCFGRSPRGGNGNQRLYSCLGNPMDAGIWRVTRSQTVGHSLATKQQEIFC